MIATINLDELNQDVEDIGLSRTIDCKLKRINKVTEYLSSRDRLEVQKLLIEISYLTEIAKERYEC